MHVRPGFFIFMFLPWVNGIPIITVFTPKKCNCGIFHSEGNHRQRFTTSVNGDQPKKIKLISVVDLGGRGGGVKRQTIFCPFLSENCMKFIKKSWTETGRGESTAPPCLPSISLIQVDISSVIHNTSGAV